MASTSAAAPETPMDITEEDKLEIRDKEITKLIQILEIIVSLIGDENEKKIKADFKANIVDIDVSDELAGCLMTVFTCLRKEENDQQGFIKYKAYSSEIMGTKVTISSVVEAVKAKNIKLDFLISTPIVELMTLFKASFDEVRTGVTRFRVRESVAKRGIKRDRAGNVVGRIDKSKDLTQNITQYGLNNHHVPLLQGITFAPERRTGVIRSLGPMAQAIMLTMEDKYYNKLSNSLANSLQMLPMANEVINCLKEARTPGSVAGILKELGDILIITTARATQKFYFPLLLYVSMWQSRKKGEYSWSFSGTEMIKKFSTMVNSGLLRFRMKTGGDELKTSQVVFHAMFGTYLDDLSVCEQITTHHGKWFQRKEVNSVFMKRGTSTPMLFKPIAFIYVSKMAQALLTKSLGNVEPVDTCRPSFSGMRKRNFTQDFLNYLRTGKASQSYSNDPIQLQYALKKTKDQIMEDLESVKILKAGTTKWEQAVNGVWTATDFEVVEGNSKFFGV